MAPRPATHPHGDQVIRVGPFGAGLSRNAMSTWAQDAGLTGSRLRRTDKTVNVLHRREPGQNSQDTHDGVYVLPEPQVRQAAIPVIVDALNEMVDHARRAVPRAQLRERPELSDQRTATADRQDFTHSPFTPPGTGCTTSLLM
ncbi:hypothetical protein AB0D42_26325 [Streptomyces sp. NPDC048304]|uniref:hypothetical protein n=1 Tax=Streptomyces sp. NPDC048304 TaxID=3154820 RepID=UPI0033E8F999